MDFVLQLTIEEPGTVNVSQDAENATERVVVEGEEGKYVIMMSRKIPCVRIINLPESFLPAQKNLGELRTKCIELARSLGGIAKSINYPWEGNTRSKHKFGEIIELY